MARIPTPSPAVLTASIAAVIAFATLGCDSKQRGEQQTPASSDGTPVDEKAEGAAEEVEPPQKSDLERFTKDIDGDGPLYAVIKTSAGDIRCDLHAERAPLTVTNFVGLALGAKTWRNPETGQIEQDEPYYDSVTFHRVIPNFLIQAGDRSGKGTKGPGYTIPDEFHPELEHDKAGVLSMANRGEPDSGGAQWFILEMPAPHLDERHSVFGQCQDLDVVRKISRTPTGPDNRPQTPPVIESIEIERADGAADAPNEGVDATPDEQKPNEK
ncbi:MAG: peptidylprolyl isomerase [Myxococcota bacterium]